MSSFHGAISLDCHHRGDTHVPANGTMRAVSHFLRDFEVPWLKVYIPQTQYLSAGSLGTRRQKDSPGVSLYRDSVASLC